LFAYIVRRLLFLPFVLVGVTLIIVLLMQLLSPAERAAAFVRSENQLQNLDALIEQYGLNDPWYMQYGRWVREAFQGNLGFSRVSSEPVLTTIRNRFPATLELAFLTVIPIVAVGIYFGTLAALNRDRFIDQATRVSSIVGYSLPTFVLGIWLLVIFYGALGWFEPGRLSTRYVIELARSDFVNYTGMITVDSLLNRRFDIFLDALWHLVLPVASLTVLSSARILRVMRSSLLDTLSQDYVRTARSKGLSERVVNRKHARRNALIPVLTLAGLLLVGLLDGVVITETVFNYPGVGQWGATAAVQLDYAAVLGFAVFTALIVVVSNLLVDIFYAVIDPRIRYD